MSGWGNLSFLSSSTDYTTSGDSVIINYNNLPFLEEWVIELEVAIGDENQTGNAAGLLINHIYNTVGEDDISVEETIEFSDIILCAYDPNDISVSPARGNNNPTGFSEALTYKVRFENEGNYFASNVFVDNPIDMNIDLNSLRVIDSSHPMQYNIYEGEDGQPHILFEFKNIQLPGTNGPEQERQGYIVYQVNNVGGLSEGTEIFNQADIYFDQNKGILTNQVMNTLTSGTVHTADVDITKIEVMPNPAENHIIVRGKDKWNFKIYDLQGQRVSSGSVNSSGRIDVSSLVEGVYIFKATYGDQTTVARFVKI